MRLCITTVMATCPERTRPLIRRAQVRLTNIAQVTQGWILKGCSSVLCSDDQHLLSRQGRQKTLLSSRRNLCSDVCCNSVRPSPPRLSNLTVSVVISEININQTFLQAELKRHVFYFLFLHLRIQMTLPSFQPFFSNTETPNVTETSIFSFCD